MKKILNTFVSVVLVTDQYTDNCAKNAVTITDVLKSSFDNYELLVIDNGLPRPQLEELKALLPKVACLRIVRLAKPDTTDTAVFAGIESTIGDYICILYNNDPATLIPQFVEENINTDIVFGIAKNLFRKTYFEKLGAKLFYWYSRKYLHIDIPTGSTYFMSLNRNVANALTRNNRTVRHIRQLANLVGFESTNIEYSFANPAVYNHSKNSELILKALDMASGYSSRPIRAVSYFGILAAVSNLIYASYVVIVNLSTTNIEKGWTTLSLQSSIMFFLLFMIIAVLAEYIGKILVESRKEPAYHIMQELSSTISITDETRRNVTK